MTRPPSARLRIDEAAAVVMVSAFASFFLVLFFYYASELRRVRAEREEARAASAACFDRVRPLDRASAHARR